MIGFTELSRHTVYIRGNALRKIQWLALGSADFTPGKVSKAELAPGSVSKQKNEENFSSCRAPSVIEPGPCSS